MDEASIAAFARSCGDPNPLHYDAAYAATTRYGGIIACGPQLTSMLMALTARALVDGHAGVGLNFSFRLRRAVRANEPVRMRWTVERIAFKPSLRGTVIGLAGAILRADDEVAVTAQGEVLRFAEGA